MLTSTRLIVCGVIYTHILYTTSHSEQLCHYVCYIVLSLVHIKLAQTSSFFFLKLKTHHSVKKFVPIATIDTYNYVTVVTNIYFVIFMVLIVTRNYYDLDRHKTVTKELLIYNNLVILMSLICHRFVTKKFVSKFYHNSFFFLVVSTLH